MKRYLLSFLLVLCMGAITAQTFNYTGINLKQEHVRKKNVYELEHFVMLNYQIGSAEYHYASTFRSWQHQFGFTYGQVKLFGWYVSGSIGTGMHYTYDYQSGGYYNWYYDYDCIKGDYPLYTGKQSKNAFSLSAGGIVRMVIPLYFYLGAGYGYQSVTRELAGGKWTMVGDGGLSSLGHGMVWDIGLQGNIKGFTLSAGFNALMDYHESVMWGFKFGLGYTFKAKQK